MKSIFSAFAAALCFASVVTAPVAAMDTKEASRPLLVVRFNQEHVYYQRALKQAVEGAEKARPGVSYHLVSTLPTGNRKGAMRPSAEQAKANVSALVDTMKKLGVDASRIKTESANSASAMSQEVRIYVE